MKITARLKKNGFTLVELLIVIALIAILSVAVLATINPIEQTNKARDAKYKNDAAEVLSALERYYAANSAYPWNVVAVGGTIVATGQRVSMDSLQPAFGVGVGTSQGVLVTTSELKSSFLGKEPFQAGVTDIDKLYLYYNGSDSIYVCFHPKALANKQGVPAAGLKCMDNDAAVNGYKVVAGQAGGLLTNLGAGCSAPSSTAWTAADLQNPVLSTMLCVPEGQVQ